MESWLLNRDEAYFKLSRSNGCDFGDALVAAFSFIWEKGASFGSSLVFYELLLVSEARC